MSAILRLPMAPLVVVIASTVSGVMVGSTENPLWLLPLAVFGYLSGAVAAAAEDAIRERGR